MKLLAALRNWLTPEAVKNEREIRRAIAEDYAAMWSATCEPLHHDNEG